jgi:hypothetical protein
MTSSSAPLSTPEGPGDGAGAPNFPEGFADTFTSRYVDAGELLAALTAFLTPYREGGGGLR